MHVRGCIDSETFSTQSLSYFMLFWNYYCNYSALKTLNSLLHSTVFSLNFNLNYSLIWQSKWSETSRRKEKKKKRPHSKVIYDSPNLHVFFFLMRNFPRLIWMYLIKEEGFPDGSAGKSFPAMRETGFHHWDGKIPWRRYIFWLISLLQVCMLFMCIFSYTHTLTHRQVDCI